jgi:hypothetical protein
MAKKCITLEKLSEMINEEHGINPDFSQLKKLNRSSSNRSSSNRSKKSSKKSSRGGGDCTVLDSAILAAVLGSISLGVCVYVPYFANKQALLERIKAYINNQIYNGVFQNTAVMMAALQGMRQTSTDVQKIVTDLCKHINDMRTTTNMMGGKSKRRSNNKRKMTKKIRRLNR